MAKLFVLRKIYKTIKLINKLIKKCNLQIQKDTLKFYLVIKITPFEIFVEFLLKISSLIENYGKFF